MERYRSSFGFLCGLWLIFFVGPAWAGYVNNGDGTVTDTVRGLMWQQETPDNTMTWAQALSYCENLSLAGHTDWRLPTRKELRTLVDYSKYYSTINTTFFDTVPSFYWSSTTSAHSPRYVWGVCFNQGYDNFSLKYDTNYVRAVRTGTCFLMGYLTDAITKKPLAGVTVTVDGVSNDVTDNSGLFNITGLGCGAHTISVKVPGYAVYNRTVINTQSGSLNIALAASNSAYGINTASGYSADPVNTATGNYIYTQRDFEIPGIGLPLVFERTYNSQDETDNSLGYGWNHTYNARLVVSNSDTVTVHWGDGKTETWVANGSGGYTRQYGVFDDLIDLGNGTFSVNKKDSIRYFFNAAGRLSGISDKNDNEIELVYSGDLLDYIVDTAGRHIDFSYNGNSRITKITDPAGGALQFSYDANGNLVSAANMNGHTTTFSYDTLHQMLTVTDPRGSVVVSNTYDADKRVVTSQKDAKQGQTLYVYSQTDRQTTITDALGNKTIHVHDDLLRLVQETDPLNHSLLYAYDDKGNRVKVTDKKGQSVSYTYDTNGNVLSKTDALNQKVTIEYDSRNNPTRRTDAMGNVTQFQYDSKGNLILTSDALGNLSTQTYTAKGQIQSQTNAAGQATTYGYDTEGNRNLIKKPEGQESRFTYDAVGRQITRTSPLGQVTTYTFDKMGNLLSEKDPYGYTQQYAYDANGNKIKYTDALGKVTQFAYDVKNLLISVTDALNQVRTYTYDALDRKLTETDPNGHTIQYVYDAAGRLIQIIQGQLVTVKTYNANGKQITETNPSGKTSTFGYDALNRLISRSDPLGNTLHHTYDANDRMIIQTDAAGKETRFAYDIRGRLTKVQDPAGGTALYTYDGNGNRLGMTDPNGHITQYKYDRAGRLIETTEPLGGKYIYGYDAADNRTSMKDPAGRTLLYKYDNKNRLIQITRGTGDVVTYSYSPTSLKTVMVDSLGTTQYTYDALSRLTAVLDPFGKKVQYTYDKAGNQTRMIYPDGKTVDYAYDSLDRLVSLSDWMGQKTTYQYNAAGDLITAALPNGITTTLSYDAARRMTALGSKKSTGDVVMNYAFTLDAVGNHQSITQTEPLAPVYEAKNLTYTQDVENRLLTAGTKTFTHDANGNMTGATGRTFAYDVEDRLLESVSSGNTQRYSYNGNGLRYTRTESGKTVRYVLDFSRKLPGVIAETSDTGAISAYYVYGLGLTEKIAPDGTAMYYHFDARGSTVAITDGNQNVQATYSYGPFGEKLKQTGAVSNPFTFMGRYGVMDDNNGLYYVRARYYWPEIGRFLNKDLLIGNAMQTQSLHRYVYGMNNPIMFVDVSGFSALESRMLNNLNLSSDRNHELLLTHKNQRQRLTQAEKAQLMSDIAYYNGQAAYYSAYAQGIAQAKKNVTTYTISAIAGLATGGIYSLSGGAALIPESVSLLKTVVSGAVEIWKDSSDSKEAELANNLSSGLSNAVILITAGAYFNLLQ